MTHTELGLLVLSGSSGRLEEQRCEVLRGHGIDAVPMQWFGGPGQPETPRRVPLESFLTHLDELDKRCRRIGIVGTSFGAEAALLLAVHDVRISLVVALSPTAVAWQCPDLVDGHPVPDAKWTWRGDPVPGVAYLDQSGLALADARELHEKSLAALNGDRAEFEIPVETIDADLVISAGGADRVWPSAAACEDIVTRRTRHGQDTTFLFEAEAGHRVVLPGEGGAAGPASGSTPGWRRRGRPSTGGAGTRSDPGALSHSVDSIGCGESTRSCGESDAVLWTTRDGTVEPEECFRKPLRGAGHTT